MSMVYCRDCGESITATETVCPRCGAIQVPVESSPKRAFELEQWSGFWRRVCAQIIDAFIICIPLWIAIAIVAVGLAALKLKPIFSGLIIIAAEFLVVALYQAALNSSEASATWGRRAIGIAVLDAESGETLGFGRAFLRSILSLISGLFILPQLVQLVTAKRQSLADLLTGSVVVRRSSNTSTVVILATAIPVFGVFIIGILAAIAIPAYQDYTVRARVTEGLTIASTAKTVVALNAFAGARDLGTGFQTAPSRNVASISIDQNGVITVTMNQVAKSVVFSLSPMASGAPLVGGQKTSGTITWRCAVATPKDDRFVPPECRI